MDKRLDEAKISELPPFLLRSCYTEPKHALWMFDLPPKALWMLHGYLGCFICFRRIDAPLIWRMRPDWIWILVSHARPPEGVRELKGAHAAEPFHEIIMADAQ